MQKTKLSFYAFLAFVFTIPIESAFYVGNWPISAVLGLTAAALFVMEMRLDTQLRKLDRFHWFFFLFFFWSLASYIWSEEPEDTIGRAITYAQIAVMMLLFWALCGTRERLHAIVQAYVAGLLVLGLYFLWEYKNFDLSFLKTRELRFQVLEENPNEQARWLALGVPLAIYLWVIGTSRYWRLLNLFYPFVATYCVLLTSSKGGSFTLGVTLVGSIGVLLHYKRAQVWWYLLLFVLAAVVALPFVPELVWDRLGSIANLSGNLEKGTSGRVLFWKVGLQEFFERPLLGVGSGAFSWVTKTEIGLGFQPHNLFVSILVETGSIGMFIFLVLIWRVYDLTKNISNKVQRSLFYVLMFGLLSSSMVGAFEFRKQLWLLLSILIAYALQEKDSKKKLPVAADSNWLGNSRQELVHRSRPEFGPPNESVTRSPMD